MFDKIYINEKEEIEIKNIYALNKEDNTIKLIFTKKIESTECMFNQCSDISEVDLSNFDSSSIKSFAAMFQHCSPLKFVNFSSLDTSSATYMGYIFYGCSSLK
jgi:surface protein